MDRDNYQILMSTEISELRNRLSRYLKLLVIYRMNTYYHACNLLFK
jgi:xylose isomerase